MTARQFVRTAAYPMVMAATLATHAVLLIAGLPLMPATYGPVALAALAIMTHERLLPYRCAWRADAATVANDAAFLVIVQMLLPRLLAFLVVLAAARLATDQGWIIHGWWPGDWPVAAQVVLMTVLAEFPRYWLHRAFHRLPALWRLHAVHHAPTGLYWLNVGRFHPIEKTIQFLVDALPFILLGVPETVLAAYFVFYAVNGFYQHSNCDMRLGPLNYLISGPELHRWHHSRNPPESDTNFGNNLIIWDLLFGTRFLPADASVSDLGLRNPDYPRGFAAQMAAPFTRDPNQETVS